MPLIYPFGFLGQRGGSIQVNFRAWWVSITDTSSPVFSNINIGDPAADRIVVAGWHLGQAWSNPCVMNVSGVGNITMQPASPMDWTVSGALASLWWAHVPSGTTASFTAYSVSTSGSHALGVWVLRGASIANPIFDLNFTESPTANPSLSVNVARGGAVIGMARQVANQGSFTWSGLTENFDETWGTDNFRASGASRMFQNAASNYNVAVTPQTAGTVCRLSIASFRPAP